MSLETLPPEIRIIITEHLERVDLTRLGCVNKNNMILLQPRILGYQVLRALNQRNESLATQILHEHSKVDTKVSCRRNMTAIHLASLNGYKDIIRILIGKRGNKSLLEAHDMDQNTPLIYAARYSDDETISLLVQEGANANARNVLGETALHLASSRGREEAVKCLLEANASASLPNAAGMTPLWYAVRRQYSSIVKILVFAGAATASQNSFRETELHLASRYDNFEIAKLLLDGGANPCAADLAGWTPLIWAARNGNADLTLDLILKGAEVEATDKDGSSALDFAIRAGHSEVFNLLRNHITV